MTGRYDRAELEQPDTIALFDIDDAGPYEQLVVDRPGQPPQSIQHAFERFDRANPWVAVELRRMALDLVAKGHRKIGIGMLFEVLRWRVMRSTTDTSSVFRLNNNYRSRYARMLMETEPALDGVFDTRKIHSP